MEKDAQTMEKIVALCRRRGFIFGSSEIYGGIGGFWDYGPLGTELKRNIKDAWWFDMVRNPPPGPNGVPYQMVGLDCSIIMNPKVWEASGHVGGFMDRMVACKAEGCKRLFRADQVFRVGFYDQHDVDAGIAASIEAAKTDRQAAARLGNLPASNIPKLFFSVEANSREDALMHYGFERLSRQERELFGNDSSRAKQVAVEVTVPMRSWPQQVECPACRKGSLTEPREFNLMFQSHTGAVRDDAAKVYLRPETAQGIFVNFKNVMDSSRVKLPFGIAQIGKAFRNEINPRNFTFRSREFEQMEIEFFCKPDEHCVPGDVTPMQWYEFWSDLRVKWYESLGIQSENLRPRAQTDDELAHYSRACTDIEYLFPFSEEPQELEGVAHRGDYDLKAHGKASKGKEGAYAVVDNELKTKYVPFVIEPSAGADRCVLAVLCEAYSYDESRASPEFLNFHPRLAPIKAAVFPLVAKDGLPEIAAPIYEEIRKVFPCQYEAKQSIGKRYARMDEAGTPFCFTIDGQTKEDGTVTVRNRDDATQIRIDKSQCLDYLRDQLRL